ncbi:hypothetical protein BW723_08930 [Polaribacter reichenbachii]|uniref:Uncharacterized protein n=1 Tax=Polaribacter reichenbachii TaxID=996801 RepID=A0A1B8U7H3_9FLAO|nr:DUF3857 domain-containing protein [Polaribacter reichenbachii]APZ46413.1 hypothetical protein BW723_08930 [Polaribacter reichenbachii]AUC20278.1 hypothetical protein BTO17_16965 [Polaribacter reichenbachii]OBY67824.1 hypothetical protein LPB301_00570 [Polaribacter reichenbachii]
MKKSILLVLVVFLQLSTVAQDYKFGKVSKAELEEEFYPLDSTADAAYLYRNQFTHYEYDPSNDRFNVVKEVHNRIKIYSEEGFEKATDMFYYYSPKSGENEKFSYLRAYTFNLENGKVTKDKLSKKSIFNERRNERWAVRKITLPNIKVGSVLDIEYKISSPYYGKIDDLEFQFDIPVKKLEYNIEIPEFYKFNQLAKGYLSIRPKVSQKSNSFSYTTKYRNVGGLNTSAGTTFDNTKINYLSNILEFSETDIPALKDDEPYVSYINNYRGGLKFELKEIDFFKLGGTSKSFSTDWKSVSKAIFKSESFGEELEKTNYYKNDVQQLLANTATDFDKIAAVFQFVKTKIKWNGSYGKYTQKGVKKAYKENTGNVAEINLMLTSMLRFAGLDANPVLVSSRNNGIPLFPTLDGFNYVVSAVTFSDGNYVLLDATELYSLPNILPVRALNWNGRMVRNDGSSSWVKLSSGKPASKENIMMLKITDDLMVEGMIRTKFENINALNFRADYNHIKEESLRTKYEEENNIEIDDFNLKNKQDLNKPVLRTVKFISEDLIEEIGNKIYIEPSLFLTTRTNPFKLEERKFPVDFNTARKVLNRVSMDIPEGYVVEKIPEPMAMVLPDNLGTFKYKVTQIGNKLKTFSVLEFKKPIIPAQYYVSLKDFYGKLVQKQTEKIVLVKQ